MKLGLAWRVGLVIALCSVLAVGLSSFAAYQASRRLLLAGAEARLQTAAGVLARQLAVAMEAGARDLLLLATHPRLLRPLLQPDAQPQSDGLQLFEGLVRSHAEYQQLRLIDADRHGLERVRVDRDATGVRSLGPDELLEKGHLPYVYETLTLAPGAIYVSGARLGGEIGDAPRPTLQMAVAVRDATQRARGVVVVTIDLERLFAQLAADLPPGLQLYLLNRSGDYLIHPEPARAFAFERGQRGHVLDEYPSAAALLAGRQRQLVTSSARGTVVAFAHQPASELPLEGGFVVGLAQPLAEVLADGEALGLQVLRIGLALSAVALLLAALLAQALTRPLLQVVEAVRRFGDDAADAAGDLPLQRRDEIGLLARSVQGMQAQIRHQLDHLQTTQRELDLLASRDSLTGLLNRRVFLDRLAHALAKARRDQGQLTLLFVDLDRFKAINDQHGHATGDLLLQALALRLQQAVREADTVARLGGDEFVVLLEPSPPLQAAEALAAKLGQALSQPVILGEQSLQIGASIGIGRYPEDGLTVGELMAAADQAMYRVKRASVPATGTVV